MTYLRIAWGDESGSHAVRDPGTYVMAAILARADRAPDLRGTMECLRLKGQRKVHWRDESDVRQAEITETLAGSAIEGLVVVRTNVADRQERQRRKCIERLVHELGLLGCGHLILESRGRADDARDRAMLDALRRRRAVPTGLHADHVPGPQDPGLWAADALCGAFTRSRIGDDRYLVALQASISVHIHLVD